MGVKMYIWHYKVTFFGSNKPIKVFSKLICSEFIKSIENKKWFTIEWVGYYNQFTKTYVNKGGNFVYWFDGKTTKRDLNN